MDVLAQFIKSRKDLKTKSPKEYEYEIEIRLKDVTKEEFERLSKINSATITEESLYSVKGSSTVTIREVNSEFSIKEKISSRMISKFNAEIVLSLERIYHEEKGMALRVERHKERYTTNHDKFRVDSTKVDSKGKTHYEIEFEVLDDDCELKLLELAIENIRSSESPQICKQINKLVSRLDLSSYMFPKPIDITARELSKNYSSGGSISLKLDGVRSFLACYKKKVYDISTKGEERVIGLEVTNHDLLTLFDTEKVDNIYYAFDIVILHGTIVSHQPLKDRIKMIPQACLALNKSLKRRLVVAKRHFMFNSFSTFSKHHQILETRIQEDMYDGVIYTHSLSYFDPVMRWKPQKTIDLLYQQGALMVYNQGRSVDSTLRMSQNSKTPAESVVSEFIVNPNGDVTLLREREDKIYPNSIVVVERIRRLVREEGNMFNVLKGLTVSMMRSYHNEVKRELLRKGTGHLLDVGSGFGGDVSKWNHYRNVTCVEPSHSNINELKRRLGTSKKVKIVQTKIEHLRGFDKSVTTLSCFFCMTLIDVDKFIRIVQRIFSDNHTCVFLCIVMSKKYVIEFFEARGTKEYVCEAYCIRLEDDNKIYIHIPDTIVLNQTENLVDVDDLIVRFNSIGFKLETQDRLSKDKFMSPNECLLSSMYELIVMMR